MNLIRRNIKEEQLAQYKILDWYDRQKFLIAGILDNAIEQKFLVFVAAEDPDWRNQEIASEALRGRDNYAVRNARRDRMKRAEGWNA